MGIVRLNLSKEQRKEKALSRLKIDDQCPCCQKGKMRSILPFGRDGPPDEGYIFEFIAKS